MKDSKAGHRRARRLYEARTLRFTTKPSSKGGPTALLESCRWYNAPVRRKTKFNTICDLAIDHPDVLRIGNERIFFTDGTALGTDMTGSVVSTGGASTRFKFHHQLI